MTAAACSRSVAALGLRMIGDVPQACIAGAEVARVGFAGVKPVESRGAEDPNGSGSNDAVALSIGGGDGLHSGHNRAGEGMGLPGRWSHDFGGQPSGGTKRGSYRSMAQRAAVRRSSPSGWSSLNR